MNFDLLLNSNGKNGKIILLLVGGDKSTQQKDIENAKEIWRNKKQ
jgi:putative addiction module killer protein